MLWRGFWVSVPLRGFFFYSLDVPTNKRLTYAIAFPSPQGDSFFYSSITSHTANDMG